MIANSYGHLTSKCEELWNSLAGIHNSNLKSIETFDKLTSAEINFWTCRMEVKALKSVLRNLRVSIYESRQTIKKTKSS